MNKIKKYTYGLQFLSFIFGFGMFALLCLRWFSDMDPFPTELFAKIGFSWDEVPLQSMPLIARIVGFVVDSIALGIVAFGIVFFNKLVKSVANNMFFHSETIHVLNILSKIALCGALYRLLQSMLISFITKRNQITLTINTIALINIAVFMVFVVLTLIAQEGTKIKQEHDATI